MNHFCFYWRKDQATTKKGKKKKTACKFQPLKWCAQFSEHIDGKGVDSDKKSRPNSWLFREAAFSRSLPSQMCVELGFCKLHLSLRNPAIPSLGKAWAPCYSSTSDPAKNWPLPADQVRTEPQRPKISISLFQNATGYLLVCISNLSEQMRKLCECVWVSVCGVRAPGGQWVFKSTYESYWDFSLPPPSFSGSQWKLSGLESKTQVCIVFSPRRLK